MAAARSNPKHLGQSDLESPLFHRRIAFHSQMKPFNGVDGFNRIAMDPNPKMRKDSASSSKTKTRDRGDNGFDPDLSFEKSFRRIGAGLRNLGNTCYLNAVLQCLTYTEPLAAYLQSGKHQSSCLKAGFCALCAIQKHVSRALQATGRILEPKDLVSNLRSISRNFRGSRQEDAHEYMVNLLESMHKCCLPSGVPSESPIAYEKSLVHKIFGGCLRSQVKCLNCSFCSNKYDPFLGLSLEIVKADTLRRALSHFTSKELLDGGARQYQCQQCKQKVKALKQLTIEKAPHVLIIHLKRFSEHDPGKKINKNVAFEPTLDLKPFVTGTYDGDLNYTLYGVLVHAGWSTHSGHYYCFIHTSSGLWYSLDDNQVAQVTERRALDQKAYILFYVRDTKTLHKKKSVNTIKTEQIILNAMGNAAGSKFRVESKKNIQNGSVARELDGALPLSISQRNQVFSAAPDKANLEKECAKKSTQTKDILNESGRETVVSSGTTEVSCSDGADHERCDAAKVTPAVAQNGPAFVSGECNVPNASKEQQKDIHSMVSGEENVPGKPTRKEELDDYRPMQSKAEVNSYAVGQIGSGVISEEFSILKQNGAHSVQSKLGVAADMHADDAKNAVIFEDSIIVEQEPLNGQITLRSMQSSCNQDVVHVSLHAPAEQTLDGLVLQGKINERRRLTVKRKSSKYYTAATSLSSSIFFGFILGTRKRLRKARKLHSLIKKEPLIEDIVNGNNSMLLDGPSVSEKSPSVVSVESARSGKNAYCGPVGIDQKGKKPSLSSESGHLKSKPRSSCDSSNLAAGKPPPPPSMSDSQMHDDESLRKSRQVEVMSMLLTQGLNRTQIPRWEDASVSTAETEAGKDEAIQIGYVGDEWDERYDKGKRKKVRKSLVLFGGPNLFQEIATRKVKRAKLRHTKSVDIRPFRIR